jgi:hypothetical protein
MISNRTMFLPHLDLARQAINCPDPFIYMLSSPRQQHAALSINKNMVHILGPKSSLRPFNHLSHEQITSTSEKALYNTRLSYPRREGLVLVRTAGPSSQLGEGVCVFGIIRREKGKFRFSVPVCGTIVNLILIFCFIVGGL